MAKEEHAAHKAALRKTQTDLTQILTKQVRLGISSPTDVEAQLQQAGIDPLQARMAAVLAGLSTLPVPRLPEVLSAEAAAQRVQTVETEAILVGVQRGELDPAVGQLALTALGLAPDEAQAKLTLALVRGKKPPPLAKPPKEAPQVREARRLRTRAAVEAYRAGELTDSELQGLLEAAGLNADVVQALVDAEVVHAEIQAGHHAAKAAAAVQLSAKRASGVGA